MVKTVAAILARCQSPDSPDYLLPERPLASLAGRPVLTWVLERLSRSPRLSDLVVAVGDAVQDAAIIRLADDLGLTCIIGFPDSILERLNLVVQTTRADHLVRVNGNFPLVDVGAVDELLDAHFARKADFSLNSHYHGLVYGLGVEVFSRQALAGAAADRLSREQKSIGSLYFHQKPDRYRIYFHPSDQTAPHFRVGIDHAVDLKVVEEILSRVPDPDNKKIIDFLKARPDLVAAQEITVPAEVSLEKALLFPEKMKSLRRNNCVTLDESYPISVELSLTNHCNHQCVWCSDADLRRRLGGQFSAATLIPLFDELKQGGTRGVVIEGGGEPTMHPEFRDIVSEASQRNLALGLITNGYLLPYIDNVDRFEWIRFSLDASTRDQYRRLKGRDGFDRVINNLMTVAATRKSSTVGVGYVLANRNDDLVKLEQLVLFLRQIGIDYIQFRPVVDHPELVSPSKLDFLKKYETQTFSVNLSPMADNADAGNNGLPCLAHSLSTVIAADGSVFLCGRLNQFDAWEAIGNLHRETFHQIWHGRQRRLQVGLVSQPDFCRTNCPQCRMTKYNRLLSDLEKIKTRNFI